MALKDHSIKVMALNKNGDLVEISPDHQPTVGHPFIDDNDRVFLEGLRIVLWEITRSLFCFILIFCDGMMRHWEEEDEARKKKDRFA